MDMKISLETFARIVQADNKNQLKYAVIRRRFLNCDYGTVRRAAFVVEGYDGFAYDIEAGRFIKLGKTHDSIISVTTKVTPVLHNDSLILWDNDMMVEYTHEEFMELYPFRILNDTLKNK